MTEVPLESKYYYQAGDSKGLGLTCQEPACMLSCSVVSNPLQPHGLHPTRLLCPWDSPGKNTEVGCHALLQGIFQTQGSNPGLLNLLDWQVGTSRLVPPKQNLSWVWLILYHTARLKYTVILPHIVSAGAIYVAKFSWEMGWGWNI